MSCFMLNAHPAKRIISWRNNIYQITKRKFDLLFLAKELFFVLFLFLMFCCFVLFRCCCCCCCFNGWGSLRKSEFNEEEKRKFMRKADFLATCTARKVIFIFWTFSCVKEWSFDTSGLPAKWTSTAVSLEYVNWWYSGQNDKEVGSMLPKNKIDRNLFLKYAGRLITACFRWTGWYIYNFN